ncbi:MAG TPA: hypothetical protein VGQ42_02855 [Candidatus Dormibacteraeota bacterium]|jgi:hypothetical protein|nr:hypothetical protein [Candidatus Dormibacteraeota bacterium]
MTPHRTTQYQFSTATTTPPEDVLEGIATLELPGGLMVTERGSTYLVVGPRPSFYDARLAVALAVLVVLAVLIVTAFSVVLVALLPLAVIPLLPLLIRDHALLAVGAVPNEDGATRVTVHGEAPVELTTHLDVFLSSLPEAIEAPPPDPGNPNVNGSNGRHPALDQPVRAPEATAAE